MNGDHSQDTENRVEISARSPTSLALPFGHKEEQFLDPCDSVSHQY